MILIEQWDVRRDGPLSETAVRKKLEAEGYRVSRHVYSPGTSFSDHAHDVDKKDAVAFRPSAGCDGKCMGDPRGVVVPRDVVHRADVVGAEAMVSLDATKG